MLTPGPLSRSSYSGSIAVAVLLTASLVVSGCSSFGSGAPEQGARTSGHGLLGLSSYPLWASFTVLAGAAALVWFAGTRLSRYADEISERSGLGQAFIGMLLLGGITSLPEIAATVTATLIGQPGIAVNNLFGSNAMNIAILALVAGTATRGHAISSRVGHPVVLVQGALGILVMAIAVAAIRAGTELAWGLGAGTIVLFSAALLSLYVVSRSQAGQPWTPSEDGRSGRREQHDEGAVPPGKEARQTGPDRKEGGGEEATERSRDDADGVREKRERLRDLSSRKIGLYTLSAAMAILVGGYFIARAGDAIAQQTGMGANFVGAILVALATSLPEVSTTYGAVRLGELRLAFSNLFGTNIVNIGLLLVIDVAYREGPVLQEVSAFSEVAAALAIVLIAIYLVGLLTRSTRKVGRWGLDSAAVLVVYVAGVALLYTLR